MLFQATLLLAAQRSSPELRSSFGQRSWGAPCSVPLQLRYRVLPSLPLMCAAPASSDSNLHRYPSDRSARPPARGPPPPVTPPHRAPTCSYVYRRLVRQSCAEDRGSWRSVPPRTFLLPSIPFFRYTTTHEPRRAAKHISPCAFRDASPSRTLPQARLIRYLAFAAGVCLSSIL